MKNTFKFGFLGLAFALAAAACNNTANQDAETTADSLTNEIESQVGATTDSLDSIGDAAIDSLDSLSN